MNWGFILVIVYVFAITYFTKLVWRKFEKFTLLYPKIHNYYKDSMRYLHVGRKLPSYCINEMRESFTEKFNKNKSKIN